MVLLMLRQKPMISNVTHSSIPVSYGYQEQAKDQIAKAEQLIHDVLSEVTLQQRTLQIDGTSEQIEAAKQLVSEVTSEEMEAWTLFQDACIRFLLHHMVIVTILGSSSVHLLDQLHITLSFCSLCNASTRCSARYIFGIAVDCETCSLFLAMGEIDLEDPINDWRIFSARLPEAITRLSFGLLPPSNAAT
ncbi:hypothetical protein LOK49_LG11G00001 [Camellia lanceoleosa]|uniref:Uncharacterized protein n=1 Tax=Camellia lanceoleosa TaxID=1840588 RepID=A0ACC0G419_9ERIC|nr:hypothetical protein LOK49_LG11G00001 [Camellia lanceoleosa]